MTGKTMIILVLGFSIITSFLILKLNANSKEGVSAAVGSYEETRARLIANSGVEVYLEKMRRNKSLLGEFPENTLMQGSYNISITGPDSALNVVSTAHFGEVTHQSIVKAKRDPIKFPPVLGALYVSSDNLSLQLNGNLEIDGNDHNINGSPGPNPPLPGIAVDDKMDSAYIINYLKPKIAKEIKGYGGSPSVRTTKSPISDWRETTENIIFAADITLPSGTYGSGTVLGTPSNPIITYVTGNVHFSGNAVGDGIMVINGNVTMSGNFIYHGIILVYGRSTIETQIVGNGGVYGSTILVGQNVSIQATGNSSFFYSSEAIKNGMLKLKSSRFRILSWWE
jgi:hypothetical protein